MSEDGYNAYIVIRKGEGYDDHDEMLLMVKRYGRFYSQRGVINFLVRAYDNLSIDNHFDEYNGLDLTTTSSYEQSYLNGYVRNFYNAPISIVHVGRGVISPLSKKYYLDFHSHYSSHWRAPIYTITISSKTDKEGDLIWHIEYKECWDPDKDAWKTDIDRSVKEWAAWSKIDIALQSFVADFRFFEVQYAEDHTDKTIKRSIYLGEVDISLLKEIYKNVGKCPCDKCLVKPTCIDFHSQIKGSTTYRRRHIKRVCEKEMDYSKSVKKYLRSRLSRLSFDKEWQDYHEWIFSDLYLPGVLY